MKKMRIVLILLTTALLLAAMTACSGSASSSAPASAPSSEADVPDSASASVVAAASGSVSAELGLQLDAPEGFTLATEVPLMYVAPNYPEDGSNILITAAPKDPSFENYTEETLGVILQAGMSQMFGADATFEMTTFERTEVDGYPALRLSYIVNGTSNGQPVTLNQRQLVVDADKTYTATCTDMNGAWADAFDEALANATMSAA